MGSEMGNNNTSSIKEEDSISEADKKNLLEDISEHENATSQDVHADDVKEENQNILTSVAKDAMEKSSNDFNDISKEDDHGIDAKEEQATHFASSKTTVTLENDSLEPDTHSSDKKLENQMHPTAETEDFQEKATGMASEDTTAGLGEESLGDIVKEETQMIPTAEAKDVEEKATGFISNNTESMIENESLEGDTHESEMNMGNQEHPIAEAENFEEKAKRIVERFSYDDETSELEGKPKKDKQDGDIVIPITNEIDVQGETTILVFDDPLNMTKYFGSEGEEVNGVRLSEKSPYAESFESEKRESLSSSSIEGTEEECRKQEDSAENHHLNDETSIKHDEEETMVITTLNAVTKSNDSELQEPPSVHHDQLVKSLSENSDERDGNEFGKGQIDTSEDTSDPSTIGNNNNGNLLTNVNYITEDSLNSFPETSVLDKQLKSDQEENCKVLNEENKLSRCESEKENPKDFKPDQCVKELKDYKSGMVNTCDMTKGSNGACNGERHAVLDSSVFEIAKNDQLEEPKVTENGLQLEVYVNNSNKASDESNAVPEQKHSVVPAAEAVSLTAESIDVDCRHGKGENDNNSFEDTDENTEASYSMVKTFEETIDQEEYFSLRSSTSLEQTNESKYFDVTVENHVFSKLTVPSLDLVDEEETSAATISTETCSSNTILVNSGYEIRLSIESNPDNPNISCQIQKSPSFNLDLRIETRKEESDQTPLLYQDKSANESFSRQTGINISNSLPHSEYDQCMLHLQSGEMPVEEKIVTMERSYSEISKAPFTGKLKDEEEAHLLMMTQTQDNHGGRNTEVEEVSSTSSEGKEKRKTRSYFFSSCMCCATATN